MLARCSNCNNSVLWPLSASRLQKDQCGSVTTRNTHQRSGIFVLLKKCPVFILSRSAAAANLPYHQASDDLRHFPVPCAMKLSPKLLPLLLPSTGPGPWTRARGRSLCITLLVVMPVVTGQKVILEHPKLKPWSNVQRPNDKGDPCHVVSSTRTTGL